MAYVEDQIKSILEDTVGRYVLIGEQNEARAGIAQIFDSVGHAWIRISGPRDGDESQMNVVRQMIAKRVEVPK